MDNATVDTTAIRREIERINDIVSVIDENRAAIMLDSSAALQAQKEAINSLISFCNFYYSFVITLLEQYPILNTAVGYAQDLNNVYETLDAYLEKKGIHVYKDGSMWYWAENSHNVISLPFPKAILAYLDAAIKK